MDLRKCKLSKVQKQLISTIYASLVYLIWNCVNEAIWKGYVRPPDFVVVKVKTDIRDRFIFMLSPMKKDDKIQKLLHI